MVSVGLFLHFSTFCAHNVIHPWLLRFLFPEGQENLHERSLKLPDYGAPHRNPSNLLGRPVYGGRGNALHASKTGHFSRRRSENWSNLLDRHYGGIDTTGGSEWKVAEEHYYARDRRSWWNCHRFDWTKGLWAILCCYFIREDHLHPCSIPGTVLGRKDCSFSLLSECCVNRLMILMFVLMFFSSTSTLISFIVVPLFLFSFRAHKLSDYRQPVSLW